MQRHTNLYPPASFALRQIINNDFVPAVHVSSVFCVLTLLALPSFSVASWVIENTFFSTTAFSWRAFGDLVLPLGASISAVAVSTFRNPMHSLLSLLSVFFCTALLYLIAGIAFVGVVFLIVYVGAVAVLFLFVIMLLNVKSLTSDEPLVRHMSQILAIVGVTLLLLQLHFILVGSFDHALAIGFLREAIMEPTTGEAISFFIRYQAMDINGLTALYTTHGILLMLITAILLAALLGAIILATVTTERATSISDLRRYSREATPLAAALPLSFFILVTPLGGLDTVLTLISPSDLDPIFLSFYYEEAERDTNLRTVRKLKQDTYDAHSFEFSTQHRPLRRFLKVRFNVRKREARKVFGRVEEAVEKDLYTENYQKVYQRPLTVDEAQDPDNDKNKLFRVAAARAALTPVLARRYRGLSNVRIMRHR
jgi:NADH:ubiquinone oxidoreductase subunit 6 (subunit J)